MSWFGKSRTTAAAPPAAYIDREYDDDGGQVHITCCDDNLSLCGEDLSRGTWVDGDWPDDDTCPDCVALDRAGYTCPSLLCRPRQWWRRWRDGRRR